MIAMHSGPGMVLAIVQARMSSSRLPGKVLAPILGRPMILRQLERLSRCRRIGALMVATSFEPSDDPLAEVVGAAGIRVFRGDLQNVLGRFLGAAQAFERENGPVAHVVRLTADCPVIDPEIVDQVIALHIESGADYTGNGFERSFPDGLDAEIMTRDTLDRLARDAKLPEDREHVTYGIRRRRGEFKVEQLVQAQDLSKLRWTVDTPEDLAFIRRVFERLYPMNPHFSMNDILALGAEFERRSD